MTQLFGVDDQAIVRIHDEVRGFARAFREGRMPQGASGPITLSELVAFLEPAFWASLRANEGRPTRFCATFVTPDAATDAIAFNDAVRYNEVELAKIAPAMPPSGALAVSAGGDGGLVIWGFAQSRFEPWAGSLVTCASEPGVLRVDVGIMRPFAILNRRSDPVIAGGQSDLAWYLQNHLGKEAQMQGIAETRALYHECLAFQELARAVLAEGHGGTVLIVPDETGVWRTTLEPFPYRFEPPDRTIPQSIRQEIANELATAEILEQLKTVGAAPDVIQIVASIPSRRPLSIASLVRPTAALAAVDGAVVITRDQAVLGFGAKITATTETARDIVTVQPGPADEQFTRCTLEQLGAHATSVGCSLRWSEPTRRCNGVFSRSARVPHPMGFTRGTCDGKPYRGVVGIACGPRSALTLA